MVNYNYNNNTNHTINTINQHHIRTSNGTQACAACKYQRRKCAPDCILAPYFPHDKQKQFLNAHKLFGVSNITKIIRNLSPQEKDMAMRTIIFQSDARAKDPVGGCYRIIAELNYQYEYYKAELELVLQQIQMCKAQICQQQQQHAHLFQMGNVGISTQSLDVDTQVDARSISAGDHNNEDSNELINCDNENYNQYQALMRYYYDEDDQGNTQQQYLPLLQEHENDEYSWVAPVKEEGVLASSNSSTSHGECFIVKSDFEGLEMKPHIEVDQRTELSGDIVALKEEKTVLETPEEESFHHIYEHDHLRNTTTLFTVTN